MVVNRISLNDIIAHLDCKRLGFVATNTKAGRLREGQMTTCRHDGYKRDEEKFERAAALAGTG
jgi:hypothetical protein